MKNKIIVHSMIYVCLLFAFATHIYANEVVIPIKEQDSTKVRQFAYLIPNGNIENTTFLSSHYFSNGNIEAEGENETVAFLQNDSNEVPLGIETSTNIDQQNLGLQPVVSQDGYLINDSNLKLGLEPMSSNSSLSSLENTIPLIEDKKEEPSETKPQSTTADTKKQTPPKKEIKQEEPTKKETTKQIKKEAMSVSDNELDMLAKIIYAEAGNEPYKGKVAVGAVVLNRVQSGKFPDSIKEVIFAPKQFSPISDGSYAKAKPGDDEYNAAKEALNGEDPTEGALYFYAPTLTKTRWHETLDYTVTIGGHKFYK